MWFSKLGKNENSLAQLPPESDQCRVSEHFDRINLGGIEVGVLTTTQMGAD